MSDFEQCSNPLQPDLNYDFMGTGDFVECLNGNELGPNFTELGPNFPESFMQIDDNNAQIWLPKDEMRLILRNYIPTLPNVTLSQSFLDNCDK